MKMEWCIIFTDLVNKLRATKMSKIININVQCQNTTYSESCPQNNSNYINFDIEHWQSEMIQLYSGYLSNTYKFQK